MSINKVLISGNLTRDPELRQTASGMPVIGFGVAVNDRRRNAQSGEWEDYANFIDCTMFGQRAEALSRILTKGMKVAIEGKLRWSQWESDGKKHSKVEVIVDEVELMTQRQQQGQQGYQHQGQQRQAPAYQQQPYQGYQQSAPQQYSQPQMSYYDEDIPF